MTDDRFANIGGLLKSPPRKRPILRIAAEPDPGHIDADATSEAPAQLEPVPFVEGSPQNVRVKADSATTSKSVSSAGGTQRVVLRLRQPLHAQLVTHAATTRSSQGDVVLDAIEAAHTKGQLAALVARAQDTDQSSLFARTKKRGPAEATVPVELRLRREAVAQIDHLATETAAESRTQLIVVALQNFLRHAKP